ncbi:MAG: transcription-repair coupling factor [Caldilineaceae bacterium]|nr:transcription-repair coupling factor [Caldilineaceae bacterium]
MNLSGLLPLLRNQPAFQDLLFRHTPAPQKLYGAARALVVAAAAIESEGPVLVLAGTAEQAEKWVEQLALFLPPSAGPTPISHYADPDALPYERIPWTGRTRQLRLTALAALQNKSSKPAVVVASPRALMQKTLPARMFRMALRPLRAGSFIHLDELTGRWVRNGYEPTQVVEEPGTFARRGGIVDIWPPNLPYPVRIDLFGDEVETLRSFDPATQRSEMQLQRVLIGPGSEALGSVLSETAVPVPPREASPIGLVHEQQGDSSLVRGSSKELSSHGRGSDDGPNTLSGMDGLRAALLQEPNLILAVREEIVRELEDLGAGRTFRGIEWYLPYLYSRPASLLDHLPDDSLLVIDDGEQLAASLKEAEEEGARTYQELLHGHELPSNFSSSLFSPEEILDQAAARLPLVLGASALQGEQNHEANSTLARQFVPCPHFAGQTKRILQEMRKYANASESVVLVSRQTARLQEELREAQLPANLIADLESPPRPGISLLQGVLPEGFVMNGSPVPGNDSNGRQPVSLRLYTDSELFGWTRQSRQQRRRSQSTVAPELFFADVSPNDYVVHMEHGIGVYEGLTRLEMGGVEREYLQVNYARGDKLYVPVHQADRLSRYVGAGDSGIPPSVTRLGTSDWQTVKARAKKAVEDIAEDLLKLYAEREVVPGYAFSPDGPWQEEMEAAFPFRETADQIDAIIDVKRDMETDRPMDRIIIGDVGYGKTEVAIRAAFKAVMDGKQTAVLVPTTVLAQQHFRVFSERLEQFPILVEMLSRFRTQAQQEKVLQKMREGTVDIVIGTHRLLSKDVEFNSLGLLVIDEEQRFGVSHKERLKQIRSQMDVLTLSATPIPRTLHMSLSGVRDMSTINTPPRERLPVRTILSEFDSTLVRQAVQRELERDGQVFFVHNRVRGLQTLATRLKREVPEAVVAIAHGQMAERELEDTMMRFADGEIDVLVCTTIVENGLDIRRANTIIVNRADHFGLAQLYQLRGRVGRGAVRGYCYLFHDRHITLSFDARRRLEALLESSDELGAGFRIAMRDLEIRGAGELLGARQHGQIASVGFDLYTRLLTQSVNELREMRERLAKAQGENGSAVGSNSGNGEVRSQASLPSHDEAPLPMALDDPLAPPVTLDLPLRAEIPADYVEDEGLRLQLYRRIAGLNSSQDLEEMRKEIDDRFGKDAESNALPQELENLFYQIEVKMEALRTGILNIGRRRDQIAVRLPQGFPLHAVGSSEVVKGEIADGPRRKLQSFLRMGLGRTTDEGEFIPNNAIHVGREAVYIPIDEVGQWRTYLLDSLKALRAKR